MAAAKPAAALRCGWLENVTPGNFSLVDRDAEWTIAEQGGYEAPGFDRLPDIRRAAGSRRMDRTDTDVPA
jgi:hypothetical protein